MGVATHACAGQSRPPVWQRGAPVAPLLPAVVAGQGEEERATHESRLHFPPVVAHPLNEAIQVETSQPALFLDSGQCSANSLLFSIREVPHQKLRGPS
jgi:hypothetical protein